MKHSLIALALVLLLAGGAASENIPLVVEGTLEPAAAHGVAKFEAAVAARGDALGRTDKPAGRAVIVGVATPGSRLAKWAEAGRFELAKTPEALAVKRFEADGVRYLAFVGSDAMGLQYALFDAAEQLEFIPRGEDWFGRIKEISEKPANGMRRMRVIFSKMIVQHQKDAARSPIITNFTMTSARRKRCQNDMS